MASYRRTRQAVFKLQCQVQLYITRGRTLSVPDVVRCATKQNFQTTEVSAKMPFCHFSFKCVLEESVSCRGDHMKAPEFGSKPIYQHIPKLHFVLTLKHKPLTLRYISAYSLYVIQIPLLA